MYSNSADIRIPSSRALSADRAPTSSTHHPLGIRCRRRRATREPALPIFKLYAKCDRRRRCTSPTKLLSSSWSVRCNDQPQSLMDSIVCPSRNGPRVSQVGREHACQRPALILKLTEQPPDLDPVNQATPGMVQVCICVVSVVILAIIRFCVRNFVFLVCGFGSPELS